MAKEAPARIATRALDNAGATVAIDDAGALTDRAVATVGIIVTTFNHAHFLGEALDSVRAASRPEDTVIVVDDGSNDDPASVVARFTNVRLIRRSNGGLAAARNTGLAALDTTYVVFLDADDRLEPGAIAAGLDCFARAPESGLVYGGHCYIDTSGQRTGPRFAPAGEHPYVKLLGGNFIGMHGAVMYRRECLVAVGGFDESLRRCEDYDTYLRMARHYPIIGHPQIVAAYRQHGGNMSANHRAMLRSALAVHARYEPSPAEGAVARDTWAKGRQFWRDWYTEQMALSRYARRQRGARLLATLPEFAAMLPVAPRVAAAQVIGGIRRRVAALLPGRLGDRVLAGREHIPPRGRVRFGDLHRIRPISDCFGYDRGLPIDRYYIEGFLARHAADIRGRVLEVGDDAYTRKFGGSRVCRSDVLHVHFGNPRATFVGDVSQPGILPDDTFDCIVFTQTLHLVFDFRAAIEHLHQALAPGGVLLVTVPGISQVDRGEWGNSWFWSFTPAAMRRLFTETFAPDDVAVERYGNVFAAIAFLQGLAVEEVNATELEPIDDAYPVIAAVRARKRDK